MLLENETASYHDSAKPADLISNETIQTHLPQIQSIASRILTQTSDRREQLRLILSTLKSNYRYDDEMIKNNVIRKLTTTEALARGQGVCQHYAVLFTAIARALKIPTRIVLGLSLINGRPSGHAWVESEVQLNQWQVIEPQNERGLETTQTRFYFPTSRALILEDKTHKTQDGILEIMKANYLFKEAQ
jgi:transglutaminase/protease-like cytokinesis protein 3